MAKLINCKSCNASVSKAAAACPQCGEPMKRKPIGCGTAIGLVFLVVVVAMVIQDRGGSGTRSITRTTPTKQSTPAVDCSKQANRQAFIDKMIANGYWQKVTRPATLYHVHVLPSFILEATFDDKQQFISVVSAFSQCEGGDEIVTVVDAMTGKDIGTYSKFGLSMD